MDQPSGFQLEGSGPDNYERFVAPIMAPFVEALLDRAAPGPGAAVLDVACGTGFVSRAATRRVGSAGRVVGADLNPGMLAKARVASAGTDPAIEWHEAPAGALPFPDAEFDIVVCQQGMQFFPDLDAAVAECARVLRPRGRLAATVWAPLERSPYFRAQQAVVQAIGGDEEGADFAAAFACSPERLSAAFTSAGLRGVTAEEVVAEITLPPLAEFVPGHFAALPWGAALGGADGGLDRALSMMATDLTEALAGTADDGGSITVPFASTLVSGAR